MKLRLPVLVRQSWTSKLLVRLQVNTQVALVTDRCTTIKPCSDEDCKYVQTAFD